MTNIVLDLDKHGEVVCPNCDATMEARDNDYPDDMQDNCDVLCDCPNCDTPIWVIKRTIVTYRTEPAIWWVLFGIWGPWTWAYDRQDLTDGKFSHEAIISGPYTKFKDAEAAQLKAEKERDNG